MAKDFTGFDIAIIGLSCRFPGAEIQLHLHQGMRLADMHHYDPYGYELAAIFLGANNRTALRRDFEAIFDLLDLRFGRAKKVST